MANYNINKSDGTPVVITTGSIDNSFDIPFIGQDSINYGDDLATANLRLLENFANSSAPAFGNDRTIGQLWYDTTASEGLKVWDGGTWDLMPLDTDVVHLTGPETIAGVKTFSSSAVFTAAAVPFSVNSTTRVDNLNAALLDGNLPTSFATAAQGVKADDAEPDLLLPATNGFILTSTTGGVRSWISPTVGTGNVDPVDAAADTTTSVLIAGDPTGLQTPLTDGGLTYNSATNALTTTTFIGALTGNATTATTAASAVLATAATTITLTDTESAATFVVLSPLATGNQGALTDEELTYNASTGALTSTSFVGVGTALTTLTAANITLGTLVVERGGTGVTTSTGTGGVVLSTSPTFITQIDVPTIDNASGVNIQWNGTTMFDTQDRTATGNTSGARVRAHSNSFHDVGFNVLPQFNWNTNDILQARHCGHVTGQDSGTRTLTLEGSATEDFPVGGIVTVVNAHSGNYTITEGAGADLFFIEPGVDATDTTGGAVIGAGGVATIYRFSATLYYIWGSEITP